MKYSIEIVINIAHEEFITKFDKVENMKYWQRGLVGYEVLNGIPGEKGTTMKLDYKMGKREISMVETIIERNFPDTFHATYNTKGVYNIQKNYFYKIDEQTTKWVSESEFQFSGIMMKLMAWIMPDIFKKQSMKYLIDFKNFAEKGISVLED